MKTPFAFRLKLFVVCACIEIFLWKLVIDYSTLDTFLWKFLTPYSLSHSHCLSLFVIGHLKFDIGHSSLAIVHFFLLTHTYTVFRYWPLVIGYLSLNILPPHSLSHSRCFSLFAIHHWLLYISPSSLTLTLKLLFAVGYFLLKSFSAGQPSSFCLQKLHVNLPLINPLPKVVRNIIINTAKSINQLNFKIKIIIPTIIGINDNNKSGIKSLSFISIAQNLAGSPFLKKSELILPLPKPHSLPQ